MAPIMSRQALLMTRRACKARTVGKRLVVASSANLDGWPQLPQQHQQVRPQQQDAACSSTGDRQFAVALPGSGKHVLMLSSTTSAAAAADAALPTAFARAVVGAALALSTVYALLSSPASSTTGTAFAPREGAATDLDNSSAAGTASATTAPSFPALPVLSTPEQFDAFVIASNRAGYLAVILFHAPWCQASLRMEKELQRQSQLVAGRRVVFARVDCSIKQSVRPKQPLGQSQSFGFRLQRCDLTQLHRIHKTPTVRMYYNNACVDEVIGFRPVDFRQATSDLAFKYQL